MSLADPQNCTDQTRGANNRQRHTHRLLSRSPQHVNQYRQHGDRSAAAEQSQRDSNCNGQQKSDDRNDVQDYPAFDHPKVFVARAKTSPACHFRVADSSLRWRLRCHGRPCCYLGFFDEYRAQLSQPMTKPTDIITNRRMARGIVTDANRIFVSTLAVFCRAMISTKMASTAITPSLILCPKSFIEATFEF
jgi:hypothetical protein